MKIGEMTFFVGLALALVVGILSGSLPAALLPFVMAVLVLLGLVVGLLNIKEKEAQKFLIAVIALLAATTALKPVGELINGIGGLAVDVSGWISSFLGALAAFIAPAAFIVALKLIYDIAKK